MAKIRYQHKDITTVTDGIVGHGVNCRHAMGSGVAGAIIKWAPEVREQYMLRPSGETMLGVCDIVQLKQYPEVQVANLYTQLNFGHDGAVYASEEAIEEAVANLLTYAAHSRPHTTVYLPRIASGLGGLDWETQILPAINRAIEQVDKCPPIIICDYE